MNIVQGHLLLQREMGDGLCKFHHKNNLKVWFNGLIWLVEPEKEWLCKSRSQTQIAQLFKWCQAVTSRWINSQHYSHCTGQSHFVSLTWRQANVQRINFLSHSLQDSYTLNLYKLVLQTSWPIAIRLIKKLCIFITL